MGDGATDWDINLRTNLRLWENPSPNIVSLVRAEGEIYDESSLLSAFPKKDGKTPTDTRAVRNTFEVLAHAGLMLRSGEPQRLKLSPLGRSVFSFLGAIGEGRFANQRNRELLAAPIIRAMSTIVEVRAIWALMRRTDNCLSNEELNRAMSAITEISQISDVGASILTSRLEADPTIIGERIYKAAEFGTEKENDQRKAMNPHFLLAGGGGLFISVGDGEMRTIEPWAVDLIDDALAVPSPMLHASTDSSVVNAISAWSCVEESVIK